MSSQPQAMTCPRCEGVELRSAMTKQGVEVDYCRSCGGIWLDKGEIFHFAKHPKALAEALRQASQGAPRGELTCPRTGEPMVELKLFDGQLSLDACPRTGGLWLDRGELEELVAKSEAGLRLEIDERVEEPSPEEPPPEEDQAPQEPQRRLATIAAAAQPLPNLFVRSAGVLFLLYALLVLVLIALVELGVLGAGPAVLIGVAIVALQFLLGPFIMDISLRWFYRCEWADPDRDLPEHLTAFVTRVAEKQGIRFPRIGIIDDGAPNAFTYGHYPSNARIVITRGLFELLDDDEVDAVVAHEIGHAVHWDMLVMTMAYLVPLVAYYAFRTLISIRTEGRDKSRQARYAAAIGAFVVYIISQYIVLWLSRTREYYADRFAGEATGKPNTLASALVKIGYGLAGQEREKRGGRREGRRERSHSLEAVGALGIFDAKAARGLAISASQGAAGSLNRENLKGAMRWDMWNPWAKFYELNSTHPLIAHRLDHLGRQAASRGEEPLVVFDLRKPECYWDEFFTDLAMMFLPALLALLVVGVGAAAGSPQVMVLAVSALGAGMLVKTLYSYRGGPFPEMSVASLLKQVKVSGIRGVPCTVKGTVIGRGVPGLIWSEDFVVRDETGILFLDYRQPWRIFEFFFGLLRRGEYDNVEVEAAGWYRRAPVPYLELKTIATRSRTRRCYVYYLKLFAGLALTLVGVFLALRVVG